MIKQDELFEITGKITNAIRVLEMAREWNDSAFCQKTLELSMASLRTVEVRLLAEIDEVFLGIPVVAPDPIAVSAQIERRVRLSPEEFHTAVMRA